MQLRLGGALVPAQIVEKACDRQVEAMVLGQREAEAAGGARAPGAAECRWMRALARGPLARRGLEATGLKAVMVARLQQALALPPPPPT